MTTPRGQDLQGALQTLAGGNGKKLDAAGAACVWAGVPVGSLSLVAALNYKNGWRSGPLLDIDLVANKLAGTTKLSAQGALSYLAIGVV